MLDLPFINFEGFYGFLIEFVWVVLMPLDDLNPFGRVQSDFLGLEENLGEKVLGLKHVEHWVVLVFFRLLGTQHRKNRLTKYIF